MDQGEKNDMDQLEAILLRSQKLGFLGSMPVRDQIEHANGFGEVVERRLREIPERMLDLGSGGGVPGLVLAHRWVQASVVLLDSNQRRVAFLDSEIPRMQKAERVTTWLIRAEAAGRDVSLRGSFPVVTSRSFGAPAVTAECAAPLLQLGGLLVTSEPPDSDAESRWDRRGLEELGLSPLELVRIGDRFTYHLVQKVSETNPRYPRRVGIPSKRPMF